jgi:hypothetical protein
MAKTEYLFAIQSSTGHEVLSWKTSDVDKFSEVTSEHDEKAHVARIRHKGEEVASETTVGHVGELTLYRWDAEDKLAKPVAHAVPTV